ncbi:S8 family serine peptidase [Paraburkholderia sp. C35]|uniref:S8 family serine peptidase n=1 Tax=Paraburkholderia sp. C35 TaxID=2126993 RepID=UPI000D68F56C|nr:S8 family serine peptidase [Paraburkholderia sp. C35]
MTWQSLTGTAGAWSGIKWTGRVAGTPAADPYLVWADSTGFADLGGPPADWVRVIIELQPALPDGTPITAQSIAENLAGPNAAWQAWIQVSSFYRYPPASLRQTRFLTAAVTKQFFTELDKTLKDYVKRFEIGMPVVPDDAALSGANGLAAGGGPSFGPASAAVAAGTSADPPQQVFLGVMDDGLAFAHERFRTTDVPAKTRIVRFWNQDDAAGTSPGLHYGSELDENKINALLADCTQAGQVDEDAVYRQAGYIDVRRRWAHGTEVMDLAGGVRPNPLHALMQDPDEQARREALKKVHLLGVQFKTAGRAVRDTSGRWFAVYALDAIRYILRCADDLASGTRYCVVLNLSYGYMAGPHDGSSIIEQAIDELIGMHRDLSVIVPAGNSNLLRCHGYLPVIQGAPQAITWRALPDCATPSFLEIWLPQGTPAEHVSLTIKPPSGVESPPLAANNVLVWQSGKMVTCTAVYIDPVATGQRSMILIALAPTYTRSTARSASSAGNWTVTISNDAPTDGALEIHAWVQRNETAYGFPMRGRQSRFDDIAYKRFVTGMHVRDFDDGSESWITRGTTLNSIATGDRTVVVGAYRRTDGTAATYSSTGPTLAAKPRTGPDAAAISEDSPACAGVLGASTRSGTLLAITGTSAAAPQVARLVACYKVQGQAPFAVPLTTYPHPARDWVAALAAKADPAPPTIPPHDVGKCPATLAPPVLPLGQHAWVPALPAVRAGSGRFSSARWKKRGIGL